MSEPLTAPFSNGESAEIDRRIVEMMTEVMGAGQYSSMCQAIADRRAAARQSLIAAARDWHIVFPALALEYPLSRSPRPGPKIDARLLCAGALAAALSLLIVRTKHPAKPIAIFGTREFNRALAGADVRYSAKGSPNA